MHRHTPLIVVVGDVEFSRWPGAAVWFGGTHLHAFLRFVVITGNQTFAFMCLRSSGPSAIQVFMRDRNHGVAARPSQLAGSWLATKILRSASSWGTSAFHSTPGEFFQRGSGGPPSMRWNCAPFICWFHM